MICVYDQHETNFEGNGLCTLLPTSCTVTEQAGGMYELEMEHPITQDGRWKYLTENAIIRAIYNNYTLGMVNRAIQADIVAKEIAQSPHPVILCGDFNDVPYSYVYNLMKGELVDGFKECGQGWMYTMRGKKRVRIDYIFHDKSLTGISYKREDLSYSDHYPVFMTVVRSN